MLGTIIYYYNWKDKGKMHDFLKKYSRHSLYNEEIKSTKNFRRKWVNYQRLELLSSNCPTHQNSTFLFFIAFIAFLYFYLVCVYVGVGDAMVWMWSETDLLESFLSFRCTQITRLTASPLTCWALSLAWHVQVRFSRANKSTCCEAWPSSCSWLCCVCDHQGPSQCLPGSAELLVLFIPVV